MKSGTYVTLSYSNRYKNSCAKPINIYAAIDISKYSILIKNNKKVANNG